MLSAANLAMTSIGDIILNSKSLKDKTQSPHRLLFNCNEEARQNLDQVIKLTSPHENQKEYMCLQM